MKRQYKILTVLFLLIALLTTGTMKAFALSWNGDSTGGGGGGSPAGPNGYAIRTTGDNCIGYRFSCVNSSGNNKVSKVIDVFRNTTYGNNGFRNNYKFTVKYNKKQLINNQNNNFSTSLNTVNCYMETEMGFTTSLPTPDQMGAWQNYTGNLNAVLSVLGVGNINNLVNGDKILVEPLYDVRLEGVYHAVTVTELAIYGKYILGASSDGGSSNNSASWGFISAYTNKNYPNSLYTADGQGLWTAAWALSSRAAFYTIINTGYGVGIAYTETKPSFSPTLSVNICEAWKGVKSARNFYYGNSSGSSFSNFTYANGYPVLGDSVWFTVYFPADTENVKVRQYVRLQGGSWTTRDVTLSRSSSNSQWFDVSLTPSTVETWRSNYTIEAKEDYLDSNNNIIKTGAIKTFYIPVKPQINNNRVSMFDITNTKIAHSGSSSSSGAAYIGQRVYHQYTYTTNNTWTSTNYIRASLKYWNNGGWNAAYIPNNGGDVNNFYVNMSSTSPYMPYSELGMYTVPDNSASGLSITRYNMYNAWSTDVNNTGVVSTYDIPVVRADVEMNDIKLIDENGYYVTTSQLYLGQKVTAQYVCKNNTSVQIFVNVYDNNRHNLGTYAIPAYSTIYVNAAQMQITSMSNFSVWGGVYLDGAPIYNTSWESNGTNNAKTLTMGVISPLNIQFINPNTAYREGTEVISSYYVKNISPMVFYPTSNVTINFKVYTGGSLVYSSSKTGFVVPAYGNNLAYWRWTVPKGLYYTNATMTTEIMINGISSTNRTDTNPTIPANSSTPPDTRFEKSAPSGFIKYAPPANLGAISSLWSEWVYQNGSLVKKSYGLRISQATLIDIPDTNCPSRKSVNSVWYMGSGYGFTSNINLTLSNVSGYLVPSSAWFTNAQTASLYLPEFAYSTAINKYCSFNRTGVNNFELPSNPYAKNNAKLHFVPLWYSNGNYITQALVTDIWTPAGMMTNYVNSNPISISKSAYDDWVVGR